MVDRTSPWDVYLAAVNGCIERDIGLTHRGYGAVDADTDALHHHMSGVTVGSSEMNVGLVNK